MNLPYVWFLESNKKRKGKNASENGFLMFGYHAKDEEKKNERKGLGWWWCPFSLTKNEES